ncbi:MAG: alpha/beta hydrolase [Rubrivivax sp.]|nr:alpha/beta hydrolase [Rubrivivax sp.]
MLESLPVTAPYTPRRPAYSVFVPIRGLRYHAQVWGDPSLATPERPPLVLVHGWMDVAASYQFVVDALTAADGFERCVIAPDWRGFGLTEIPRADTYWFPDYIADLDALLDALVPAEQHAQIDLGGHSMGGNIVMSYAGLRPARIRRLINLEGFGLPQTKPEQAPKRLLQWLDELKAQQPLRPYANAAEVAERLVKNNPLLTADKAAWLAPHWAQPRADGLWHILGDPAHKRVNPILYQVPEILATWQQITAPVLWAEGDRTDIAKWWGNRYPHSEFDQRLAAVRNVQRVLLSPCGHMLHHDQPEALATHIARFLG